MAIAMFSVVAKNEYESLKENCDTTIDIARCRNGISEARVQIKHCLQGIYTANIIRAEERVN